MQSDCNIGTLSTVNINLEPNNHDLQAQNFSSSIIMCGSCSQMITGLSLME